MLETKYVGDSFGHFGRQHPLSFYINVGHQHSKDVIKAHILSPTSNNVTNFMSPKLLSPISANAIFKDLKVAL